MGGAVKAGVGRYRAGDRVRVRFEERPGHIRTPYYVRGKPGWIAEYRGDYPNPEELAYGKDGLPRRPLYSVAFDQRDLWPSYVASGGGDKLYVDLYEHWLEPAVT